MYGVEKYLKTCLDSVVNQTLKNIEIICVDDGSPDMSGIIAEEYARKYENIAVLHQSNQGQSSARNTGLAVARGKYVYFLDSDDYLELEAMEELYSKAEELQVELLSFDYNLVFENEAARKQRPDGFEFSHHRSTQYGGRVYTGQELFREIRSHPGDWHYGPCYVLFRKEFLDKHGLKFYEGIIHEDIVFAIDCTMRAQRVAHVDYPYYNYLTRENSTTTDTSISQLKHVNGWIVSCMEAFNLLQEHSIESETEAALYDLIYTNWRKAYRNLRKMNCYDHSVKLPVGGQAVGALFFLVQETAKMDRKLIVQRDELEKQKKEITRLQKQNKMLQESSDKWSQRYAEYEKKSIWLKIKHGIRCLNTNGLLYTIKHIIKHIFKNRV